MGCAALAAVAVAGTSQPANAAIVYQPVNQVVTEGEVYTYGPVQFGFSGFSSGDPYVDFDFFNTGAGDVAVSGYDAKALPAGVDVASQLSSEAILGGTDSIGMGNTAYLAFQSNSGGNIYYGYLELTVMGSGYGSITIDDLAYNNTPGQSLLTGQTSSTPEPSSLALLALGAAGFAALKRRAHSS